MIPLLILTLSLLSLHAPSTSSSLLSDAAALSSSLASALLWPVSDPGSVCSWPGVRCDPGQTHVVALDLSNSNISSSSPVVISGLAHLANLSLAGNGFSGTLTLSDLPSLRYLNVSMNEFNGDLDWDYSSLPSLQVLDAYDNNLTAPLPRGAADLAGIRYLDLGGNFFYGGIPPAYGRMERLEYLSLNGNDLNGRIPPELGNLTSLRQLYLGYYNVFDGGIPPELGRLKSMSHLDLSSCGLAGEIPAELGDAAALDTLFLHSNLLSGPIPASLGNLTGLLNLDLSNNVLTGEIPGELVGLTRLVLLNLFLNRLHGSIPGFVAELPGLQTLELFMNNFTGAIPEALGSNGRIQVLDLSSNKLTGTIPNRLCDSNQLRVLILFKNFLFGPVPEGLGQCSSLVRVRLGQNYLNGTIPDGLLYLPGLDLLELHNNYLSGPISESTSPSPTSLANLDLSNNLLSGRLPDSISDLAALESLLVSDNRLDGPIPGPIGRLRKLVKLDFSRNSFSGPIPADIGDCAELTYIDFSQNNLTGQIPPQLAAIGNLNYLNLSRNRLSDSIPRSIGSMKSLTSVDFSFNDLSGRLPDTGQFLYFNASSFAGNAGLCGPLVGSPCGPPAGLAGPGRRPGPADYRLVLALGLLLCSLVFALAAVVKARAYRGPGGGGAAAWRLTAFQKVGFGVGDVTECMKDSNIIGRGGAGVVYTCAAPGGGTVAVKRLMGSGGHDRGFGAEIGTLGRIRHRNIVRLLAVCSNAATNVLVYEYMSNGSLGEVLHGKGGGFLGWDRRYRIAVEAARGLCYLHHDCSPMIVHRDVKSNNILLDEKFEAHVADFGLARFLGDGGGSSECMSAIAGSYGYIAPEYAYTLKVDEKSDVYSFGVVLLELITGRRPVGDFGDGVDIVQWTKKITAGCKEHVDVVLDPRLSTVPMKEAMHVFFVALLCVQDNSIERPTMREVVQMLSEFPRHAVESQSPPSTSSSCSNQRAGDSPDLEGNCYKLFPDRLGGQR